MAEPPLTEGLLATIMRRRRGWRVMWIDPDARGKGLRDFSVRTLTAAVGDTSAMAADFYRDSPAAAVAGLDLLIFGRRLPVFTGPQLKVTGEPGHLAARDVRDDSVLEGVVLEGATVEDLLAAAGVESARPGDYAITWTRPVLAILTTAESDTGTDSQRAD